MYDYASYCARFDALRKKIGGYHVRDRYVYESGPTMYDNQRITRMSMPIRRIYAQLDFAIKLCGRLEGAYASCVEEALTVLETAMAEEGTLPRSACMQAESALLPMAAAAKEYTVLHVAHAHIDMNWMWSWQETVGVTLSTFRTMLNLMREYPDFTFSQSQASVYRIVEEHDPEMMEEIRARIAEGRWEVTANAWVETDKNMPDTESLIRHISETRSYLHRVWGVEPGSVKVDFSPDTFGHAATIPEINNFGSVPYYYHCRGMEADHVLYRYRAPSGKEVLMYREPFWYNSNIDPDYGSGAIEMERRCGGLKTSLIVYGLGDHGGGPSRRDVETAIMMQDWPVYPQIKFGTLHAFYAEAEKVREKLPVVDREVNAIFTGCYTTQSRIKLGNRRTEAALLAAEGMSALSHTALGTAFPADRLSNAWQDVLFTHFHDILTGSGVQETREYAMGLYSKALAQAQSIQNKAYENISRAVDTSMFPADEDIAFTISEGASVGFGLNHYAGVPNPERGAGKVRPYTVFNPSSRTRREPVELFVWDYAGDWRHVEVIDSQGNPVPMQILDDDLLEFWAHRYFRVLILAEVPAFGHAVFALREKPVVDIPVHMQSADRIEHPHGPIVLENEHLCARFDGSGMMLSLVDKASGEELLSAPAGLHLVRTESAGMTSWRISRYLSMEPVTDTASTAVSRGELRSSVTFEQNVMHSRVTFTVSLDAGAHALAYDLKADWHETSLGQDWLPLLSYRLPLKQGAESMLCDVPAGAAVRPAQAMDMPALTGACALCDGVSPALITDCKYGYRLDENVLSVSLIHTAENPDPYPERGIHAIRLFVALTDGRAAALKDTARALTVPMTAVPTASHGGILPPVASLLQTESRSCVVSSVGIAEDGALRLRLYEAEGAADTFAVRPCFAPARAVLTDLDGNIIREADIQDGTVSFPVAPCCIAQVMIYR